jgi:hypothetical protein
LHDITNIIDAPISEATVRRRRDEAGLRSYIIEERLNWALKYQDWTVDDWRRVIWSDETIVWIGVNPRRQWVIRPEGDRSGLK